MPKERITVTLDRAIVEAGQAAVADGRADSMSGWVADALRERVEHERRLAALADAVAEYEAEHGAFTEEELAEQAREDRDAAAAVRARRATRRRGSA
jgi:hypothetical protein